MEKIKTLDKFLHTWISAAIVVIIGFVLNKYFDVDSLSASGIGFITSIVIGSLKELVWDLWLKKGVPSLLDFLADVIGSVTGFVIIMIILNNSLSDL